MASGFLNELYAPLPPSSLVTKLGSNHFDIPGVVFLGSSGLGDFLQLQSPIILTAWAPRVRVLRATPPDGCETTCLQKCIPALPTGQHKETSHWPLHWGHPLTPQLPNLKSRFTSRER